MDVKVLKVRNVQEALPAGLRLLGEHGQVQESRAGRVVQAPGPVITVYTHPWECTLLSAVRDANPFFHLAEVVWMMAGRNDAAFLTPYVRDFGDRFAEEDGSIHGAYGHRWRNALGIDQLELLVGNLRRSNSTRQAVLQMWDASADGSQDLIATSDDPKANFADIPCNTHVYFRVRNAALDMTVCCRSNDLIMGLTGANAVHFSYLQQYVAEAVGLPPGSYAQVSNDYHAYAADVIKLARRAKMQGVTEEDLSTPRIYPVLCSVADAVTDVRHFVHEPATVDEAYSFLKDAEVTAEWVLGMNADQNVGTSPDTFNTFFSKTVAPVLRAHALYKAGMREEAIDVAGDAASPAWRRACVEWLQRRT